MRFLLITTLVTFSIFFLSDTPSKAKMNCEDISGSWSGNMSGVYRGLTTMKIKSNCRLSWKLPDGRTNNCRYKDKGGEIRYSCSLGSKGVVSISSNKITMQNVYTAKKHGAYTVRISKVSD